jgi:hypothetical protein
VSQEIYTAYSGHHDFSVGALASVGGGAPVYACCGSICGPGLDNANEILSGAVEVAGSWDEASDMSIHIHAVPTDSDPIADTEDIDIDYEYRSVALTETGKTGTAITGTETYTQSGGAGAECDIIDFTISVSYNSGDQQLAVDDDVTLKLNRDLASESNSYSGSLIIYKIELEYNINKLMTH